MLEIVIRDVWRKWTDFNQALCSHVCQDCAQFCLAAQCNTVGTRELQGCCGEGGAWE